MSRVGKKADKKGAASRPAEEKRYPTEKLLKSKHLAGYQRDFAKAILTEPGYTISQARAVLDGTLKGGR